MSFLDRLRLARSPELRRSADHSGTDGLSTHQSTESGEGSVSDSIVNERGIPSLHHGNSVQSRLSNVLAVSLMSALGLGLLTWYYTQTFARQSRTRQEAQAASRTKTQGEMSLPPLGEIDPPVVERVLGPPPEQPPQAPSMIGSFGENYIPNYSVMPATYSGAHPRTPEQLALERRLSGPVFVDASNRSPAQGARGTDSHIYESGAGALASMDPASVETSALVTAPMAYTGEHGPAASPSDQGKGPMAELLRASATPAAHAKVLPTQRLLLAKGSFIDCTLETAIDSTLPGMTTCVTATDTFSVDGSVVLLERGTKLVGETRGEVRQGSSRVYVLWAEARTPTGVVVPLASPGTDELGRSGLPGEVDRHFWGRFGAAILVSVIDGAIQGAMQRSSDGGTVIYSPSTSQNIMTEVLKSTIHIPPTVRKENGDRIAILVARDLDFRPVYELRPTAVRH